MTAHVARKLPVAQPTKNLREGYVARRDDVHRRALHSEKAPLLSFLADVHHPTPDKVYHWRIQLDCGCIVDRLGHTNEVTWLADYSDDYWPGGRNKTKLPVGQWICYNTKCPRYRETGGPMRDIVEWVSRDAEPYIMEAFEINGEVVSPEKTFARWDVALSCGHRNTELVGDLDWRPENGLTYGPAPKQRVLRTVLKEVCRNADDEEFWRRIYTENHPRPRPFTQCHTCADVRTVNAYQCVGTLAPKPKSKSLPPPSQPRRATLERSLKKAEAQVAELQERLRKLDDEG
ncbi:hypothetical protein [Mycobacterium hubeiense]|uniref:hypothetical protein n=1 Tax=Mycobacterium hubeiense TaxID=1867256 RepID=UPI001158A9C2|nr:hypothetical protein [Mycobacterium sp. QGD 101]